MVPSAVSCHVNVFFRGKFNRDSTARPTSTPQSHPHFVPLSPLSYLSSHFISHPLSSSLTLSPHSAAMISSLSIIVYLHSVHFLPSLMALRWGVFLVRNCNEDWNTISWMATVSFLHHSPLLQSDRCCCCCFALPVCSYWCVSSSLKQILLMTSSLHKAFHREKSVHSNVIVPSRQASCMHHAAVIPPCPQEQCRQYFIIQNHSFVTLLSCYPVAKNPIILISCVSLMLCIISESDNFRYSSSNEKCFHNKYIYSITQIQYGGFSKFPKLCWKQCGMAGWVRNLSRWCCEYGTLNLNVQCVRFNTPSPHPSLTSMYENFQQPLKMQKIMKGPLQSQGLVCL